MTDQISRCVSNVTDSLHNKDRCFSLNHSTQERVHRKQETGQPIVKDLGFPPRHSLKLQCLPRLLNLEAIGYDTCLLQFASCGH